MERFQSLVAKELYDLVSSCSCSAQQFGKLRVVVLSQDLKKLLTHTASDAINVWMKQVDGCISSFKLEDVTAALTCHAAGSSLYFRSPTVRQFDQISLMPS